MTRRLQICIRPRQGARILIRLRHLMIVLSCLTVGAFWVNRDKMLQLTEVFERRTAGTNHIIRKAKNATSRVRLCTQEERLRHIRQYCNVSFLATLRYRMQPQERNIITEDDKYLLCWMSKAGSTALKYVILESRGFDQEWQTNRSNINEAHAAKTLINYGFKYLRMVKREARRSIADHYFNMMAIRHPFDRILSYYRDKIVDNDIGSAHPARVIQILRYVRPEVFARNRTLVEMQQPQDVLGPPTFREFLIWIHGTRTYDEHWNRIIDACHPCAHHWNAIIRMETIATDGEILLERIRSGRDEIPIKHTHRNRVKGKYFEMSIPEYSSVPDHVIDYLMDMYRTDFEMFGYGWNRKTNTAFCRIETPSGYCC